jgi:hypothetical protein
MPVIATGKGNFARREKTKNTARQRIGAVERNPKSSNEVSKND